MAELSLKILSDLAALLNLHHMLLPNLLRQALDHPGMQQGLGWLHTLLGLPDKYFLYEVDEVFVLAFYGVTQVCGPWFAEKAFLVWFYFGFEVDKELLCPATFLDEFRCRHPEHFHHHCNLLELILSRKNRKPLKQLNKYTAKRPHINSTRIRNPKDNLRRPIEPTLDIRIDLFPLVAATA